MVGSLSVLMERIRGQARLARSDSLTRLANRRALEEQFDTPRTDVITLAIGDLDDFKRTNDRHGHRAGDACLTSVAETLTEHSRTTDQVFRWGGDEFAVLLPGTPGEAAAAVIERLEVAVAERVRDPDGATVRITFGWACSEGVSDCDLRTLTERVDAALRRRKPARSR